MIKKVSFPQESGTSYFPQDSLLQFIPAQFKHTCLIPCTQLKHTDCNFYIDVLYINIIYILTRHLSSNNSNTMDATIISYCHTSWRGQQLAFSQENVVIQSDNLFDHCQKIFFTPSTFNFLVIIPIYPIPYIPPGEYRYFYDRMRSTHR